MKIKTEVHEIEERKNQHINQLISNHNKAFEELKAFYNYITCENLQLVKAQKEELFSRRQRHEESQQKISEYKVENQKLEEVKKRAEK